MGDDNGWRGSSPLPYGQVAQDEEVGKTSMHHQRGAESQCKYDVAVSCGQGLCRALWDLSKYGHYTHSTHIISPKVSFKSHFKCTPCYEAIERPINYIGSFHRRLTLEWLTALPRLAMHLVCIPVNGLIP